MPIALPSYGGPTKRSLIEAAYADGGLSSEYEIDAEEIRRALRRLNALMAQWKADGVDLGYNFPINADGSVSDESGIPEDAVEAVTGYLGLRLAPTTGFSMAPEARAALARSYSSLRARYAVVPAMAYPRGTALGAGNRRRWPFV